MKSVSFDLNLKRIMRLLVLLFCIAAMDANAKAQPYSLTVSKGGTGGGTVSSAPAGIDCGTTCSAFFISGTVVTITAIPDATSSFSGWAGAATGTNNSQTIVMDANKSVSAYFTQNSYTLNIVKSGSGSGTVTSTPAGISCGGTCSSAYTAGSTITLTATPAAGSVFTGWTGACSGTGSCEVSMTSAKSVAAEFTYSSNTYYADIDGDGYGAGDVILSGTQPPNTSINNQDCDDSSPSVHPGATEVCGNSTDEDCSGVLDDCSQFAFTVSKAGSGGGTVTSTPAGLNCGTTCSALFPSGSTVTITATPDATSSFSGWSGALTGTTSSQAIVMDGAKNVSATFTRNTYTLSIVKTGSGSGTVTSSPAGISCGINCSASYTAGSSITLTATPDVGSVFTGWTGGCSGTGTCEVSMTSAKSVTASFCILPRLPEAISGNNPVCSGTFQTYSTETVPNASGYSWTLPSGWTGSSTTNSITVTTGITGIISVNANNSCGSGPARTLNVTVNQSPLDLKIDNGLLASYPFDNNANDASGNGNNGLVNNASPTTDRFGNPNKAYGFNGTSSYIDLGDKNILNPRKNSISITAWVKKGALNQHSRIFSKGTHGGTQPGYDLMFYGSSGPTKAAVILSAGGHEHIVYSNSPINDLNWHFYAGVINRQGFINLYVDGIKQNDSTNISNHLNDDIGAGTYKAFIGASYSNYGDPGPITEYFNGAVDEVQIYMRPLSRSEVNGIFHPLTICLSSDSICENSSVDIRLENSQNGISYQLQKDGTDVGNPQTGNGSILTFNSGNLSSTALFSVKAANSASTCNIILDTLLKVNVNPVYTFTENYALCNGETYSWHGTEYSVAGTYVATYSTIHGCDSTYTLNLVVNPVFEFTEEHAMCDGETYMWQGNDYTDAGTYVATYSTIHGCDSTFTLNLVVNPVFEFTEEHAMCDGETYMWQGNDYTTAGTYVAAYSTIHGCDSIYTLNLVVNPVFEFTEEHVMCDGETYMWQGNDYTDAGTYVAAYSTIHGCDSIYTLNLLVNPVFEFTEEHTMCDGETYTWQGNDYTVAGTYLAAYSTIHRCDSMYTLNLIVNTVDVSVTVNESVITANMDGATYQWLNCDNLNATIAGETSRNFTASTNGQYAVEITQGSCSDTSTCIQITTVDVSNLQKEDISIYPNPVTDKLFIEVKGNEESANFEILNAMGQVVFKGNLSGTTAVETSSFDSGIYLIKLNYNRTIEIRKVIIE
jgi:hypothetical protein